jgi:hypothetical protein
MPAASGILLRRIASRGAPSVILLRPVALVLVLATVGDLVGCAPKRTPEADEAAVRERLSRFSRQWAEADADGVRGTFARSTPDERELSDAFADLLRSSRQVQQAQQAALARVVPWPLRRYVKLPEESLIDLTSRWAPYAHAAGRLTALTAQANDTMLVETSDSRVTFVMRPESGGRRWVIDPATFQRVGDARTVAAQVREEVPFNQNLAAAFATNDPAKVQEAFANFVAARATGLLRAVPDELMRETLGGSPPATPRPAAQTAQPP